MYITIGARVASGHSVASVLNVSDGKVLLPCFGIAVTVYWSSADDDPSPLFHVVTIVDFSDDRNEGVIHSKTL